MAGLRLLFILLLLAMLAPSLDAQTDSDFDSYRVRIDGFWFYSNPSGSFQDATTGDTINLHKDFGFGSYSTFTGKMDWKFTRKNHIYVVGAAFDHSRLATLQRTIVFQGQTFNVGLVTKANLSAPLIAPGYQYDIIRRRPAAIERQLHQEDHRMYIASIGIDLGKTTFCADHHQVPGVRFSTKRPDTFTQTVHSPNFRPPPVRGGPYINSYVLIRE